MEQETLSPAQHEVLGVLAEDPDHFGVLLSDERPELGVLAVDRTGAAFLKSLKEPGGLPRETGDPIEVARLVLDGILEVEWDGLFVTGPSACACLFPQGLEEPVPVGPLPALSFAALRCIQDTPLEDPRAISSWLYAYHCIPMSPFWARRFSSPEQVSALLGLQPGGAVGTILDDGAYVHHQASGWHSWQSLRNEWVEEEDRPVYKLYISPHPNALVEILPLVVRCLVQSNVSTFKLGVDGFGLLRPDKLIAYFSDYSALAETAASLETELAGCPAHGVPFTAALTEDGLLSWGIDPPRSEQIPGWRSIESWRVWIANLLARAILRGRSFRDRAMEPWQYALLRLRLEGVQIQTWLPAASMWGPE